MSVTKYIDLMTQFERETSRTPTCWNLNDQDAVHFVNYIMRRPEQMPSLTDLERIEMFADPMLIKTSGFRLFGLPVKWLDHETSLS